MKIFEREAIQRAVDAVKAALAAVKSAQVSVHTDYACGVAASAIDNALRDLEMELVE